MTKLDLIGDRCCVMLSLAGLAYILYWHLL